MSFRLLCLRHGRTAWNATGRFQGQTDVPLDDIGRGQVAQTARHLATKTIDLAVCSDLQRARETAEIVLAPHGLTATPDADLRERNFGDWEGLTWSEIVARHPHLADHTVVNARIFEPPNGEHFRTAVSRVMSAYDRLHQRVEAGQTALLVAHAGVLHALFDGLFGPEREDFMITPASVLAIDIDESGPRFVEREHFTPSYT